MLTNAERQQILDTGMIPVSRLNALVFALRQEGADARAASKRQPDQDGQFAASLRGKATAYYDAALRVEHIAAGRALHPRPWSTARRRAQEWGARRRARAAS